MVTIPEIVGVVGGIAGIVSLGLIIYKAKRERPIISCEIDREPSYNQPQNESDNFITFSIGIKFHNRGLRPTTIHDWKLSFEYENKKFIVNKAYDNSFQINQDSSTTQFFPLNIKKEKGPFNDSIKNSVFTIRHTFGEIVMQIENIKENK